MKYLAKKVEVIANIAIILVSIMLAVALTERYLLTPKVSRPSQEARAQIQPGTKLSLPGVDWGKNDRTILMVMSTGCHFCTESAPFYQRLAQEKSKQGGTHLVAVLPEDVAASQKYLSEHGVVVDEIRQASPASIQVSGTPTLILADQTGSVIASWVGKLPPDKEAEVLSRL